MTDAPQHPADWYPAPGVPGQLRYWNGTAWTEHFAPDPKHRADPEPKAPARSVKRGWLIGGALAAVAVVAAAVIVPNVVSSALGSDCPISTAEISEIVGPATRAQVPGGDTYTSCQWSFGVEGYVRVSWAPLSAPPANNDDSSAWELEGDVVGTISFDINDPSVSPAYNGRGVFARDHRWIVELGAESLADPGDPAEVLDAQLTAIAERVLDNGEPIPE